MPKQVLKVRRTPVGVGDKKAVTPFRRWLNEQKLSDLTYLDKETKASRAVIGGEGWTVPDFILEGHKRGVSTALHWGTVLGWARGKVPRDPWLRALKEVFPKITFVD